MKIKLDDSKPIYLQIAEGIENDILNEFLEEENQVMSTTQFSEIYGINPATSRKGMNLLVDEGILYKKRGIGMFVKSGALEYIKNKRRKRFFEDYVLETLNEGKKLELSKEDIINMIKDYKEWDYELEVI